MTLMSITARTYTIGGRSLPTLDDLRAIVEHSGDLDGSTTVRVESCDSQREPSVTVTIEARSARPSWMRSRERDAAAEEVPE